MSEDVFMMTAGLQNERIIGEDQKIIARHCDVPITSYLDAYNLVINSSEETQAEVLPSIKDMMAQLVPQN